MMRALLVVVMALAAIWFGYWVVGSTALQRGANAWLDQQAAASGVASREGLRVQGFPNRFDLTVDKPHLADPRTGYGWEADFAQVFSMTWKPWHLIFALSPQQTITTPGDVVQVASSAFSGSLVLVPGRALDLDRAVIDGADLVATSRQGWVIGAAKALVATRQEAMRPNGHEMSLTLSGVAPDPGLLAALQGKSDLPPLIDSLTLDAVAGFSAPVSLNAGGAVPEVTGVMLKQAALRWGDLVISAKGEVAAGAEGLAEGRIDIHVENWRKLLPPAVAMGLIKPEVAPTVENMMALLAAQSGDGTTIDLPLVMTAGRMSLGPIPLGPAPRIGKAAQG